MRYFALSGILLAFAGIVALYGCASSPACYSARKESFEAGLELGKMEYALDVLRRIREESKAPSNRLGPESLSICDTHGCSEPKK